MSDSEFKNRLAKNLKKLSPLAAKLGVEAYRIYDRDLPNYPYMVDRYGEFVLLHDRREDIDFDPKKANHFEEVTAAVKELLAPKDVVVKRRDRQRQDGEKSRQYEKISRTGHRLTVKEGPARYIVNLYDYLDTGLFLDHRRLREYVFKNVKPGQTFLNLFSYTGSVSVMAALAGARVTSVDLSNTYTEWAQLNFEENKISASKHEFIVDDVMGFLVTQARPSFDWLFVDPPTFSNSKSMEKDFEVERDQVGLIESSMDWLKPGGKMIFSNNKRTFRLDPQLKSRYGIKEISKETLPFDFHDAKIRHVFILTKN